MKIKFKILLNSKDDINKYVYFTNTESDEETIVLVDLALYLATLTTPNLLNRNIPNEPAYREIILSQDEWENLFKNNPDNNPSANERAFQEFLEKYGH